MRKEKTNIMAGEQALARYRKMNEVSWKVYEGGEAVEYVARKDADEIRILRFILHPTKGHRTVYNLIATINTPEGNLTALKRLADLAPFINELTGSF